MTVDELTRQPSDWRKINLIRSASTLKFLVIFSIAFSLTSLSGALSGPLHPPTILLGNAVPEPCVTPPQCLVHEYWYPAGAAMDSLETPIFTDGTSELACFQAPTPCVDLTDTPLPPAVFQGIQSNPNIYVTLPVSQRSYYDIQFLLVNNFWGCNFNFGNSTCGVQIRQGIAHMIDKTKFAASDPSIAGIATAIDNPVPPNNGGLMSANPCAWDGNFTESGPNCFVGAPGGLSYHLGNATGADNFAWLQAPGSVDLNAAAQHFVNAGVATGFNSSSSVLTGINSAATAHAVNFFIRNDEPARLDLGNGLASQICYLFTGSYASPCTYLTVTRGPITAFAGFSTCPFPGLSTCPTSIPLSWGMYTGAFTDVYPFDRSLYFTYNSKFVSNFSPIVSPNGPCSASSAPSSTPADYMFLCSPVYDSLSSQMEFAPCLFAPGEPPLPFSQIANGQNALPCSGTTQFSAFSMGLQSENLYGKDEFSIPVFDITSAQYAYLSNWQRVITADGTGIPNYLTWLDAYSPNPAIPGTIRQGFSSTTRSVSPYVAETVHDSYIVRNIYDSLTVENPRAASQSLSASAQTIDWMILGMSTLPPASLTYPPPPGTTTTYRFTLRSDLFFQDGRKVTAFDVAFSYLSLKGTGAPMGTGADPVTGVTVLGPTQFDINLSGAGPFTLASLTGLPILPGAYWSNAGSSEWNSAISTCTMSNAPCYPAQYTIVPSAPATTACAIICSFPAADINVNIGQTSAFYDPVANHTLVGSGPWECGPVTASGSGTSCSSSGVENPPVGGFYTLTRFGKGLSPASSIQNIYFRSGGNLALWTWSQNTGDITKDFLNFSVVAGCFGNLSLNCLHFMMGIGGCGGSPQSPCAIGLNQVAEVARFIGVGWVAPFNWQLSPPTGIVPFAPTIFEGGVTLQPTSVAGCAAPFPNSGYDC